MRQKYSNVKTLYLEGFQTIDEFTEIEFSDITLLFGPNSAGKSCVQDALELAPKLFNHPTNPRYFSKIPASESENYGIDGNHLGRMAHPMIRNNWRRIGDDRKQKNYCPSMSIGVKLAIDFDDDSSQIEKNDEFTLLAKFHSFVDPDPYVGDMTYGTCRRDFEVRFNEKLLFKLEEDKSFSIDLDNEFFQQRLQELAVDLTEIVKVESSNKYISFDSGRLTVQTLNEEVRIHVDALKRMDPYGQLIKSVVPTSTGQPGNQVTLEKTSLLSKAEFEIVEKMAVIYNHTINDILPNIQEPGLVPASRKIPTKNDLLVYLAPSEVDTYGTGVAMPADIFEDYDRLGLAGNSESMYHPIAKSFAERLPNYDDTDGAHREALFEKVNRSLSEELFRDRGYQIYALFSLNILHERYNEMMNSLAGRIGELHLKTHGITVRLLLKDHTGLVLDFEDVGSGIGYVFPVLQAIHDELVVLVQQPELHLHPALQSSMADVFIDALSKPIVGSTVPKSIIVETHSEYVLLRLLKRIRQTHAGNLIDESKKLTSKNIAIYYFDAQIDGPTKVRRIRVSESGEFMDKWPKGFFEERYSELFDE